MDTSNVTSTGEHPFTTAMETKVNLKTHVQSSLTGNTWPLSSLVGPQQKICTIKSVRPQIIHTDLSQFRSLVQRLTGKLAQSTESSTDDQLIQENFQESKADEGISICKWSSSLKKSEHSLDFSQECLDCIVYCSLFPKGYEIDHNTLIQLWMAEGIINEEPLEDMGASCIEVLSKHKEIISLLKEDYGTGKIWYKLNNGLKIPEQVRKRSKITSVRLNSDDPTLTRDLKGNFTMTRALLLLSEHKAKFERIPYDFFMSLQNLRALDLRRTKVSELPSSIGQVRCLCYLDLSETLIKRLPESIEFLKNLQTLKLLNCNRLVALPKATKRLTRLRHLDLGNSCSIHSMPPGMGTLTCLRSLSQFIVGRISEFQIGELENMNELGGKLCLSRLENVDGLHQARKANLSNKHWLKKLDFRWTDDEMHHESISINHNKVIEHLRPHTNLQDLRILCYGGSMLPRWISHPSFIKLTTITLFKCTHCLFLPSLGQLPSLKSLSLIELTEVRLINFQFRRENPIVTSADDDDNDDDQFSAFPVLENLEIKSMVNLEKWSDMGKLDFPCLEKISIKECPKVDTLCKFTNMISLEYLELYQCTKLPSLPEGGLPASLKTLVIESCPSLVISLSTEMKQDWVNPAQSQFVSISTQRGRRVEDCS